MRTRTGVLLLAAAGTAAALVIASSGPSSAATLIGTVTRVSNSSTGGLPDQGAAFGDVGPTVSSDGRYVTYLSGSTNIVPGSSGGQVYLYDTKAKKTTLVSTTADGSAPNGEPLESEVSGNGRYVAWTSYATDIIPLPPVTTPAYCHRENGTGCWLLYLTDTVTHRTSLVSQVSGKAIEGTPEYLSLSSGGRYVVYNTDVGMLPVDTNGFTDVYRYDSRTGSTVLVSHAAGGGKADQESRRSQVSANGDLVAFQSGATDIAPTGTTAHLAEIFLADIATGRTVLVSHDASGTATTTGGDDPAISGDGSRVAYRGGGLQLYDVAKDTTQRVSRFYDGLPNAFADLPSLSTDGRFVSYELSTTADGRTGTADLVRYDAARNSSLIVRQYSYDSAEDTGRTVGLTRISGDARHIAFGLGTLGSSAQGQVYEWSAP